MPGRLFLETSATDIAAKLSANAASVTDEPPRRNIAPGQEILVCGPDRDIRRMRWGIIPVGRVNARGRPVMETVINARSESVFEKSAFDGVRRCLVPTDGWYEWTGEKRRKTAWRIRHANAEPVVFAAIFDVWIGPGSIEVPQVATLTCEPNADVRDIHHRMGVILEPDQFETWLSGTQDEAARLMLPLEDGKLMVTEANDVDWQGA